MNIFDIVTGPNKKIEHTYYCGRKRTWRGKLKDGMPLPYGMTMMLDFSVESESHVFSFIILTDSVKDESLSPEDVKEIGAQYVKFRNGRTFRMPFYSLCDHAELPAIEEMRRRERNKKSGTMTPEMMKDLFREVLTDARQDRAAWREYKGFKRTDKGGTVFFIDPVTRKKISAEVRGTNPTAFVEFLAGKPKFTATTREINAACFPKCPQNKFARMFEKNPTNRAFWDAFVEHESGTQRYTLKFS